MWPNDPAPRWTTVNSHRATTAEKPSEILIPFRSVILIPVAPQFVHSLAQQQRLLQQTWTASWLCFPTMPLTILEIKFRKHTFNKTTLIFFCSILKFTWK